MVSVPTSLLIDDTGLAQPCTFIPSPNYDTRLANMTIDMVVIHNISLPPGEFDGDGIVQLFTNQLDPTAHPYYAEIAHLRVSAHFLIRRDGALIQFVSCLGRAWHAGVSSWQGRSRCNDFAIGIELEGTDTQAFTEVQYACLQSLLDAICARYSIAHVVGHSEIAPGRKTDPGPCFDWSRVDRSRVIKGDIAL